MSTIKVIERNKELKLVSDLNDNNNFCEGI